MATPFSMRIFGPNTSGQRNFGLKLIIASIIGIVLICLIILILWIFYNSMLNMRVSNMAGLKITLERRASAINYFFMERFGDLENLAESRVLENYFSHAALGMSKEYGLLSSKQDIDLEFGKLLKKSSLDGVPIYLRIALIDNNNNILSDIRKTPHHVNTEEILKGFSPENSDSIIIKVHKTEAGDELLLFKAVYYKGEYKGILLGCLNVNQLYHSFISKGNDINKNETLLVLKDGDGCIPIAVTHDQKIEKYLSQTDCQLNTFIPITITGAHKGKDELFAINIPTSDTPIILSTFLNPEQLFGSFSPKLLITFLGIIVTILSFGLILLIWAGHRNIVLSTKLIEEERNKTIIEERHEQLQHEIEARLKTEDALRISEERYRHIIEYAADIIYVVDEQGNFTYVSPSSEKVMGYSPEELIGLHYTSLVLPEAVEETQRFYGRQYVKKVSTTYYEVPCVSKSGDLVWIGQNVRLDIVDGKFMGFYSLARDITDLKDTRDLLQKAKNELEERVATRTMELQEANAKLSIEIVEKERAEHALNEQFQLLQHLIDTIPNPVCYKDNHGRYIGCNRAFEDFLGLSREQIIGKDSTELDEFEPVVIFRERLDQECRDSCHENYEARIQHRNGKIQNIFINKATFLNELQEPAGHVSVIIDITERIRLEGKLLQSQKLESIGSLAAGVAHEINTPIQFIGDNTRFFLDSYNDFLEVLKGHTALYNAAVSDDAYNELTETIANNREKYDVAYLLEEIPKAVEQTLEGVDHVARIVRSMKEFSHPGQNEKIDSDINRAIENTITVARNEWKYSAEVITDFEPQLPMVPLLVGEFNQVVLNLIINAVHAISEKSDNDDEKKGQLHISTRLIDGVVEVRVADNGTGIPEKIRDRVFDPFFTTKEVGRGTGQGLSVSRSVIVEKHGGQLTFETEEGVGTTFIILVPIHQPTKITLDESSHD